MHITECHVNVLKERPISLLHQLQIMYQALDTRNLTLHPDSRLENEQHFCCKLIIVEKTHIFYVTISFCFYLSSFIYCP